MMNSPQPMFDLMTPQQSWTSRLSQLGNAPQADQSNMLPQLVRALSLSARLPGQAPQQMQPRGTPPWAPQQEQQGNDPFVQMLQKLIGGMGKTT
jgi:hypothetical protein